MPKRVTDPTVSTIEFSDDTFAKMPWRIKDLMTTYNMNENAFAGRTVKIVVDISRVAEIMAAVEAYKP